MNNIAFESFCLSRRATGFKGDQAGRFGRLAVPLGRQPKLRLFPLVVSGRKLPWCQIPEPSVRTILVVVCRELPQQVLCFPKACDQFASEQFITQLAFEMFNERIFLRASRRDEHQLSVNSSQPVPEDTGDELPAVSERITSQKSRARASPVGGPRTHPDP